ncbi:MAG: hypothetical protein RLZZ628_4416, partial [Bacteroidota bacterium]
MSASATAQNWQHFFKDPYVYAVRAESPNIQWICTHFGLFRHSGGQLTHFTPQNSPLTVSAVTDMHLDAQGNSWFTTLGGGLFKRSDTTWQHFPAPTGITGSNFMSGLTADNQNNIWILTAGGVFKFGLQTHQWTHLPLPTPTTHLYQLVRDVQNNLWLKSDDAILKFDGAQWTTYPIVGSSKHLSIDTQGHIWVGLRNSGLMEFDGTVWTRHDIQNNPNNSYILNDVTVDAQNNKWLSTSYGIFKFNGTHWTNFNTANSGLSSNDIARINIDAQGNKWFGCGANVVRFDGANWNMIRVANSSLVTNDIAVIATDPQNNKWFGGTDGVSKFDGIRWAEYKIGTVRCIAFDRRGNSWLGTNEGLYKLSDTVWTHYTTANSGLMQNIIDCIAIDSQNNKWLGLANSPINLGSEGGICKFDDVHWTRYDTLNSRLADNYVSAIAVDAQNHKWFGTRAGLTEFDGTTWATLQIP